MNLAELINPPSPDVAAVLRTVRERSLAAVIVGLLTDREPLLCAEQDGSMLTVRERGGGAVLRVTVEEVEQ